MTLRVACSRVSSCYTTSGFITRCSSNLRTSSREKCRRCITSRISCGKVLPENAASSSRKWKLPSTLLALLCRDEKV